MTVRLPVLAVIVTLGVAVIARLLGLTVAVAAGIALGARPGAVLVTVPRAAGLVLLRLSMLGGGGDA